MLDAIPDKPTLDVMPPARDLRLARAVAARVDNARTMAGFR
jgi:hypothetical protein